MGKLRRATGLESVGAICGGLRDFIVGHRITGNSEIDQFLHGSLREAYLEQLNIRVRQKGERAFYDKETGSILIEKM